MSKTIRKHDRFPNFEDDCAGCKFHAGKKRGCKLKKCHFESASEDANGRGKRRKGVK